MELFGLTAEDVTQLFVAIAVLITTVETILTKITHRDVKDLKNGVLKEKVKEAVQEYEVEKETTRTPGEWRR